MEQLYYNKAIGLAFQIFVYIRKMCMQKNFDILHVYTSNALSRGNNFSTIEKLYKLIFKNQLGHETKTRRLFDFKKPQPYL